MTAAISGRASELGKLCVHYQFQRLDRFGPAPSGSDLNLLLRPNDSDETLIGKLGNFEEALWLSTIPLLVVASDWARLPKDFCCEEERGLMMLVLADRGKGILGKSFETTF